jgi:hypothetical protein
MSQDCPEIVDAPPIYTVDTPGIDYQDYVGGPFSGTFQPRGPTDATFLPGLPEVSPASYHPSGNDPASWGRPSGDTGNVFTPSPNQDYIRPEIIPPFRSGAAERAFDGGDVQAPNLAVSNSGNPTLILERIRQGGSPVSPVAFCQDGQMPPSMSSGADMASLDAVGILRNSVPIAAGSAIFPGELITLFAQLGGLIGGDTVRFTIFDSAGTAAFGPVEQRKDLFSNQVKLDIVAPTGIGFYTLEATELIPLFPDNTLTFPFAVSATAPPPPAPKPGTLGSIQGIVIALTVLAAVVIVGPALSRIGSRVGGE